MRIHRFQTSAGFVYGKVADRMVDELLNRFAHGRDQAAFTALVERYGLVEEGFFHRRTFGAAS